MIKNQSQKAIPKEFICPISLAVMNDPVMTSDGHTFQRSAINDWLEKGKKTNPLTNKELQNRQLAPNRALKSMIAVYVEKGQISKNELLNENVQNSESVKTSVKKESKVTKLPQPQKERVKPLQNDGEKDKKLQVKEETKVSKSISTVLKQFDIQWKEFEDITLVWLRDFKKKEKNLPQVKETQLGYYKGYSQASGKHGQGIMVYKDGNVEFGEWKNDMLDGKGQKYFKSIRRTYSGYFKKGKFSGLGQISDPVSNTIFYRGEWTNGKKNGIGIEVDGVEKKTYSGQWLNDVKHGVGKQKNALGDVYEGMWKNGVKEGRGIKKKKTGEVSNEFWKNGKEWGSQNSYKGVLKKGTKRKQQPCQECVIF